MKRSFANDSKALATLAESAATLRGWLFERALPLWWGVGADRISGGFYERLDPNGEPIEEPRRARVVARQLFVFSTAARMGWPGPAFDAIGHAFASLRQHLTPDGALIAVRSGNGQVLRSSFDLYDYAFALFGLAAVARSGNKTNAIALAGRLLNGMAHWKHPIAGFEENVPRTLPLKANPHMHMLEACLAWTAISADRRWPDLADEIVELALSRFVDPVTGALHEFFNGDWIRMTDPKIDIVEPGHQFEWSWLLQRWSSARDRADARLVARRLANIGENSGVDRARRLAIDGLTASLEPAHDLCRLWPQTERLKAWALAATAAEAAEDFRYAIERAQEAATGLLRYLDHPVPGSWWENIDADGMPLTEPARASSLYHIVCAIWELEAAIARLQSP